MSSHPPPAHIVKRDGTLQPFDAERIVRAIARAGAATGEFSADIARILGQRTAASLHGTDATRVPDVEDAQDAVERLLIDAGYVATARAYIVYREQHTTLRDDRRTLIDVGHSMEEYLEQRDWRVNANASQGYSLGGLILNVAGKERRGESHGAASAG